MKYILLVLSLIFTLISIFIRIYFYSYKDNSISIWGNDYQIDTEQQQYQNEGFLENKKNPNQQYNKKHVNMDNKHKTQTHTAKIAEKTHAEIGQFENTYQEAAYQFISAIYNRIDSIHHKFEIIRHKKDPFLATDAKYFKDVNPKEPLSSVDHYQKKYESYLKQTIQFLSITPAITEYDQCVNKFYYRKPTHNEICLDNCNCTGGMICNDGQCVGNSNQNQSYNEAQQQLATSMYTTYFANFLQKYHMKQKLGEYVSEKGKLGVTYDEKSVIETAETLYEVFYQLQQIIQSTKAHTGFSNTNKSFDKPTFQFIAQQARLALNTQLKVGQIERLEAKLGEIAVITQKQIDQVQDKSQVQQWIDLMVKETEIPEQNYQFPEIQNQVLQFLDQDSFQSDNIGDYLSFYDVLHVIKDNNFDAGTINSADEMSIMALGSDIASVVFTTLFSIFC